MAGVERIKTGELCVVSPRFRILVAVAWPPSRYDFDREIRICIMERFRKSPLAWRPLSSAQHCRPVFSRLPGARYVSMMVTVAAGHSRIVLIHFQHFSATWRRLVNPSAAAPFRKVTTARSRRLAIAEAYPLDRRAESPVRSRGRQSPRPEFLRALDDHL